MGVVQSCLVDGCPCFVVENISEDKSSLNPPTPSEKRKTSASPSGDTVNSTPPRASPSDEEHLPNHSTRCFDGSPDPDPELESLERNIVLLQALIRTYIMLNRYNRVHENVVMLQRWTRCVVFKLRVLRRQRNATLLQSYWRMSTIKRKMGKQRAAIVCQAVCRGGAKRSTYKRRRVNAIKIQRIVRGYASRTKCKKRRAAPYLVRLHESATVLQCWIRCCLSRRVISQLHEAVENQSLSGMIQREQANEENVQDMMTGRIALWDCVEDENVHIAATHIQKLIRKYRAQNTLLCLRRKCVLIQCWWRCMTTQPIVARLHHDGIVSARLIQRPWQSTVAREATKEQIALVKIQSAIRMSLQARCYRNELTHINIIQNCYRGFAVRSLYAKQKRESMKLQAMVRSQRARTRYLLLRHMGIVIQRAFRGFTARSLYLKHRKALSKLQAFIRGHFVRAYYMLIQRNNTVIQRVWRGFVSRSSYQKQKFALIQLQAAARGRSARNHYMSLCRNIVIIQHWMRSRKYEYCSVRLAAKIRERYDGTSVDIQPEIPGANGSQPYSKDISSNSIDMNGETARSPRPSTKRTSGCSQESRREQGMVGDIDIENVVGDQQMIKVRLSNYLVMRAEDDGVADLPNTFKRDKRKMRRGRQDAESTVPIEGGMDAAQSANDSRVSGSCDDTNHKPGQGDIVDAVPTPEISSSDDDLVYSQASSSYVEMSERLKNEIVILRALNAKSKRKFCERKSNEAKLLAANKAASVTFQGVIAYAKKLTQNNEKLVARNKRLKIELSKNNTSVEEIRGSLEMRRCSYVAEVRSRLQAQQTLSDVVEYFSAKSTDPDLVEEIILMSERYLP